MRVTCYRRPSPPRDVLITYDVGGRQYIAVAAGSISPIWPLPETTSRVVVFGLQ
jgi:hypothetical protein